METHTSAYGWMQIELMLHILQLYNYCDSNALKMKIILISMPTDYSVCIVYLTYL